MRGRRWRILKVCIEGDDGGGCGDCEMEMLYYMYIMRVR